MHCNRIKTSRDTRSLFIIHNITGVIRFPQSTPRMINICRPREYCKPKLANRKPAGAKYIRQSRYRELFRTIRGSKFHNFIKSVQSNHLRSTYPVDSALL